jgi:hypothetical protein
MTYPIDLFLKIYFAHPPPPQPQGTYPSSHTSQDNCQRREEVATKKREYAATKDMGLRLVLAQVQHEHDCRSDAEWSAANGMDQELDLISMATLVVRGKKEKKPNSSRTVGSSVNLRDTPARHAWAHAAAPQWCPRLEH